MPLNSDVGSSAANSYASVAEATAYFSDSLNSAKWQALTNSSEALVSATREIDLRSFSGNKADSSQALQFPRSGISGYSSTEIPLPIKIATYNLALSMASGDFEASQTSGNTTKIKVGPIQIEKDLDRASASTLSIDSFERLIAPFLLSGSDGSGFTLTLS